MIQATFKLVGSAPISFSKVIMSEKDKGESHDAFEQRTWRERLHTDENGEVFIPPMAIKNCIVEVSKYLQETVKGKGKATYTKYFEAGILATEPIMLGVKAKDVPGEKLHVPSDGRRGGASRVWKTFPYITPWSGMASLIIIDRLLIDNAEKVREYLEHAGKFIGLGRFRPRNNGYYGRFTVENWKIATVA